ncbi:hypothetical protein NIES37_32820 [Tolypothrix tenuis PCC 7101]|uniref:Uncharacterized protein n=1 Tax=Tolypothrix tenuis PCC 7101 TaxID=231146 RepID=A0A1Z4N0R4_9CYAN|nr:hypothetical protein NIES37_32820 [Tolypothrix tenuis PCC 7101]BAZ76774.1 hypothetical protein NIES50_53760 [Aulosira laxa NIES-50]
MDCLRFQSLIGIYGIQSLKAEKGTVIRSQSIVSIPHRELEYVIALDFDLQYKYSTNSLVKIKKFVWSIHCELKLLYLYLIQANAKPKCRPPPVEMRT